MRVTYLPVKTDGRIDLDQLRDAITDKTILISIMYANNEIGVVQPMKEIAKIAKEKGILFHSDAVQAVGKIPVNVITDGIDVMSLTAHKLYGPKGVGALYVRRRNPRVQITAQMDGGGHERGMRSGTLNVPGIVGLGAACEIAHKEMAEESKRFMFLRDKLKEQAHFRTRRSLYQRLVGASAAPQPQHQLQLCGRRKPADGHQRYRGFQRIRLHLRHA